ncbi:hypothetical protein KBY28_21175 [Ruegeria pomeroyi]|uniref:sensor histidine kinase n=1 Tax=Ruegeria pomeroyi TaxID=89184 RepID=UPI001F255FAF|nr:ATP-binding protein [Ruegeria pomeroyi]MCE8510970.1 hypothetical protein [Ruegeria pomeroyi]
MLAASLAAVAVAIWSFGRFEYHHRRIEFSYRQFEMYLQISSQTVLLFNRLGDYLHMDRGEGEIGLELKDMTAVLRQNLDQLKAAALTEKETTNTGPVPLDIELLLIERKIGQITQLVQEATEWKQSWTGENGGDQTALRNYLDRALAIERDIVAVIKKLHARIGSGLEHAEKADARHRKISQQLSLAFAAFFCLKVLITLVIFHNVLTLPLQRVMAGVKRYADGDYRCKIDLQGENELAEISGLLDRMAQGFVQSTETLIEKNEQLEMAVHKRTEELELLLEKLQRSEQVRRQLLADVSHELRTPLTIIQGESDIALRGPQKSSETYREALRRTRNAAIHTTRIVNDLLFIAREEVGNARLVIEEFNLAELLHEVVQMTPHEIGLSIQTDETSIQGDRARLRQAVLALVHNALHHGGTMVRITLSSASSILEIAVEDDGPGMTEKEKNKAFERFYRGSNAADRYSEGIGLGLPIVRSIVEAHGGTVVIKDREGGGTILRLSVPHVGRLGLDQ